VRPEVEAGLNGVERWKAAHDFLCDGRPGVCAPKQREQHEITTLALPLLHHGLRLRKPVLVAKTLEPPPGLPPLTAAACALPPWFYAPVKPYGRFPLALDRPSRLEAA
jgi:hypothetical protein